MRTAILVLIAVCLVYRFTGCTVTDEQWDAFCPDGHCPILKVGKAVNAAERQRYINGNDLPPPPPLPPVR